MQKFILHNFKRNLSSKDKAVISDICNINCLTDRFGILENNVYLDSAPKNIETSLYDLVLDRVQEIIKYANGRRIVVLFSEGVDSLCVAAALYHSGYTNLTILELVSDETTTIYKDWFSNKSVDFHLVNDNNIPFDFTDCIFISGDCADQMHHCGALFSYSNSLLNLLSDSIKDSFEKNECITEREQLWWLSYCFKWRESQYSHAPLLIKRVFNYVVDPNNYLAFFSGDVFSDWAYSNFKDILKNDITESNAYKIHWKDITYKFLKDLKPDIYSKGKVFSTSSLINKQILAYNIWHDCNMTEYLRLVSDSNGTKEIEVCNEQ